MKRWLLTLASLALGGLIGFEAYYYLAPHSRPQPHITQQMLPSGAPPSQAPAFTLTDLNGRRHKLADWRGKVILINFWAPWCVPCREEMPMLEHLQTRYGSRGLQILGPAVDKATAVRKFVHKHGITYPVFPDREAAIRLSKAYGDDVGALPYTVLINRKGHIIHSQAGRLSRQTLQQWLQEVLQKTG